ncbi:MAG: hypothetical protein AAGU11_00930 [Syntrophobacteraceae bacterium]
MAMDQPYLEKIVGLVFVGGPLALLWWDVRKVSKGDFVTWPKLKEWCKDCKRNHETVCELRLKLNKEGVKHE